MPTTLFLRSRTMKLSSQSFTDGQMIPGEFAFATIDAVSHIALSANRNPHLSWSDVPQGTRSFVLLCTDPDVPSSAEHVNRENAEVPLELERVDFFHWMLLDIPSETREILAGEHSNGVTPGGKSGPAAKHACRHGINDYTAWFASDEQMHGTYYGYDGPCPPWNDLRMHRYIFTLYALDVPTLEVKGALNGANIYSAVLPHVLARASILGTYTLNPKLV